MKLRDYQSEAAAFLSSRQRAFCVSPAGSGKTIIAQAAASLVARPFDRVVVLANTREQVEQAVKAHRAIKFTAPVDFEARCVAGKPDVSDADILIVDECHHLPAMTWAETVMAAPRIVWGFSATPWSGDWERDDSLKAFFGEENFHTVSREVVKAGGSITQGQVFIHDLDSEGSMQPEIEREAAALVAVRRKKFRFIPAFELERRALWEVTARMVRENPIRNDRIVALGSEGEGVLILVGSIEHGTLLASQIPGAVMVHSKMGIRKRRDAIEAARKGTLRCMVATSLADEGLDVPRLQTVIMASGGRSASKMEQRTGRVMRPSEGKTVGTVHDFADKGARLAHSQFKARLSLYRKLGYTIHK